MRRLFSFVAACLLLAPVARAGTVELREEGTKQGYPFALNFVGCGTASFSAGVGTIDLSGCGGVGSGDITAVGNVASGAAFNGTQGTVLTFFNAGGNVTLTYDGTDLILAGTGTHSFIENGNYVIDTGDVISALASSTSAQLATLLSDETGTAGKAVFDTAPTFQTSITTPVMISSAADPADAGAIRLGNNEAIGWEATPAGTDLTVKMDANNVFTSSVPINATTGFRIGNAAASGKFLVGDGTNFIASTSTIPTSAGATANKVLLSDGTNYVLSTPTFPNASASSGKFIRSDGTNWIASTPTLPTSATVDSALVADGTNFVLNAIGSCSTASSALTYNTTTHAFGCNSITGGATSWDTIGDAAADGSIALANTKQDITSTLDAASGYILKITNTDAVTANTTSFLEMHHNDGANAKVQYFKAVGDDDGTPTTDYLFTQTLATFGVPLTVGTSRSITAGTFEVGAASDTTIARSGAGDISVEGNAIYRAGGTDVAFADGGTGLSSAADDTVLNSNGSAWSAVAVPNCTDASGNHLNYTTSSNAFSCGTSRSSTTYSMNLPIYSAKLTGGFVVRTPTGGDASTQGAQLDAGDGNWRLLFDPTTDEAAVWQFILPANWTAHGTLDVYYSMTSATSGTVEFEADVMCETSGDSADIGTASFAGVAVNGAETVPGTAGFPKKVSITLTDDSCAAGDIMFIYLSTDANDGTNDTATGDREVIGLNYNYTGT